MPHAFQTRELEIRRYRDSDRDDVWSLHRNAIEQIEALDVGDDYYADLHNIATAYLEPGGEFLVGLLAGRIVAMGGFARTSDAGAEIKRMRVHSSYQRRGFGRAILEVLEDRASQSGVNPLFSPGGEAKCVRGPSVQGARRSARGGVLEQYVEHGEQAQRSNGGPIGCFDRQLVRKAD